MIKIKLSFLVLISVLLFGCENSSGTEEAENHAGHEHAIQKEEHTGNHQQFEAIELNDGKKWQVNKEMAPYVLKGEKLVDEYLKTNSENYQVLAASLTDQNNLLVKSCTMEGKSHDELHKWLYPHLEIIKQLAHAENKDEALKYVNQIKESYQNFHKYFEE